MNVYILKAQNIATASLSTTGQDILKALGYASQTANEFDVIGVQVATGTGFTNCVQIETKDRYVAPFTAIRESSADRTEVFVRTKNVVKKGDIVCCIVKLGHEPVDYSDFIKLNEVIREATLGVNLNIYIGIADADQTDFYTPFNKTTYPDILQVCVLENIQGQDLIF